MFPEYPHASAEHSALRIHEDVPNTESIGASFEAYKVLRGIRHVPITEFPRRTKSDLFYDARDHKRVDELAAQIKQNGYIKPLIVAHDHEGPYVLEGAHRLAALHHLGETHVPALVVHDLSHLVDAPEKTATKPETRTEAVAADVPEQHRDFVPGHAHPFLHIANLQRHVADSPEDHMIAAQRLVPGVAGHALEHGGDLLHRMTEYWAHRSDWGRGDVVDKADKVIRTLSNPYGFAREHAENIEAQARVSGVSADELKRQHAAIVSKYVAAHAALPAYNRPQRLARDASVQVGKAVLTGRTGDAIHALRTLKKAAESPDWVKEAGSVDAAPRVHAESADGKKFTKVVKNPETGRTRRIRYGAAGSSIRPGTSKGDAYCKRSNAIKGDWRSDPNSPNNLSRRKWKCRGDKSMRESLLDEAVKGVRTYLDGHHQVTSLGRHGDFTVHSAVHLHTEGGRVSPTDAAMEHHKQVHSLDAYRDARFNQERAPDDRVDEKPTDAHFVPDRAVDKHYDLLADAAAKATERLRNAGLPSQHRHVVLIDQSKQHNHASGIAGDVGGHWDKKNHVIAMNRANLDNHSVHSAADLLVHEWAHAFHDEMNKDQKAAWHQFYRRHVVGSVNPPGTQADVDSYKKAFVDHFVSHPDVRAFARQVKAREHGPHTDMLDSIHASAPHWWKEMAAAGHLSDGGAVVAQTSHTLYGHAGSILPNKETGEPRMKAIRKNAYVRVRAVDPDDPQDYARMRRGFHARSEAPDLLAVSPLHDPTHVALISHHSLAYTPENAKNGQTHLLLDKGKTAAMAADFLHDHHVRMSKKPGLSTEMRKQYLDHADAIKTWAPGDASHPRPMGHTWYNDGELDGSEYKSVPALVGYLKKRGFNQLGAAADAAHEHALKKVGGRVFNHAYDTGFAERFAGHVQDGADVEDAAHQTLAYNVVAHSDQKAHLSGTANAHLRALAADRDLVTREYGAANDHEMFATTAERMAHLDREKSVKNPQHRKLVKAWNAVIRGEKISEGVADRTHRSVLLERMGLHLRRTGSTTPLDNLLRMQESAGLSSVLHPAEVTAALDRLNIPHAIVGTHAAVAHTGVPVNTQDIDVVVPPPHWRRAASVIANLRPGASVSTPSDHEVLSRAVIGADGHTMADVCKASDYFAHALDGAEMHHGARFASPSAVAAMKFVAMHAKDRDEPKRLRDHSTLIDVIRTGKVDANDVARRLPEHLRQSYAAEHQRHAP